MRLIASRLVAAALTLAGLSATLPPAPAAAGNIAERRILGFSPDKSVFAFETFGIQDGSGFPFATIYVIDTTTDAWLAGTPFRVRIEDDTATVADARAQVRQQAAPVFSAIELADNYKTLAANPLGQIGTDPLRLRFGEPLPANPLAAMAPRYAATLDVYAADAPGRDCSILTDGPPKGFRLSLRNAETDAVAVFHADQEIPQSRGCPIGYRIDSVIVPDGYPASKAVVLLSVFTPGFEGPDRTFLAVSGSLPQ